jgi:prepilin-type N-terminal cleavage/methylation domain-containing protein
MKNNCGEKIFAKGFTLIELLVVIARVALLSSIVLVAMNDARTKSRITKAKADLAQFAKLISVAQTQSGKTLLNITGSGCSDCACRTGNSLQNLSSGDQCFINWKNALTNINNNASGTMSVANTVNARDPWNSPYLIDENEREGGAADCRQDMFCSPGPDGIDNVGTGDDICIYLTLSKPCP